jgi:hypothetical protein
MPNKYKQVYLFEQQDNEDLNSITPFREGHIKLPKPLTAGELEKYLTGMADGNEKVLFFAFRKNRNVYRIYKTGEEENDFLNLVNERTN